MELVIQNEKFTVKVDTEVKGFKEGDVICVYVEGFPALAGRSEILPRWNLIKIKSSNLAKFYESCDKHYKVIEIC